MVEQGRIGTIIVKDLSRLGRNYLLTGNYTEVIFPEYKVRFIAINDSVDSDAGDNEFAPFKNIINEWYAKDSSKKVRSAFRTKALKGQFTGGYPAYGYRKDPEDKNHLIPDDHAPLVKRMFQMALDGTHCKDIAKTFEDEKIPTPRAFLMDKYGVYHTNERVQHPYHWGRHTVYQILTNQVYLGKIISCRYKTRSFKDKRIVKRPPEDWIIVEGTHEPLVSQAVFDEVQKVLNSHYKHKKTWPNSRNKYRGVVFCGECGGNMVFAGRATGEHRKSIGYYSCNRYRNYECQECTPHYLGFEKLDNLVLQDVRKHASLAAENKDKYVEQLLDMFGESESSQRKRLEEISKLQNRQTEIDSVINKLYEDYALGRMTLERYNTISETYLSEHEKNKERLNELDDSKHQIEYRKKVAKLFADKVEEFIDIKEMTPELIHTLIEKIVIHEKEVLKDKTVTKVEIYYRFIGKTEHQVRKNHYSKKPSKK